MEKLKKTKIKNSEKPKKTKIKCKDKQENVKSGKSDKSGKPGKPGKPGKSGKSGKSGKPGKPGKCIDVERKNKMIITIVKDDNDLHIDQYYDKRINGVINKIRDQNTMIDNKIRFGWNSGDN